MHWAGSLGFSYGIVLLCRFIGFAGPIPLCPLLGGHFQILSFWNGQIPEPLTN